MNPTPAQIAAANLIEVTTYQEIEAGYANGQGPLRTFLDEKFPPVTHGYMTKPKVTPPPPPPPPSNNPSGFSIPAVEPGFTRAASDDFDATTPNDGLGGAYNGMSLACFNGFFIESHIVTLGDSLLRLKGYTDPTNMAKCWEYDEADAAAACYIGGAGIQSIKTFPIGTTFGWACKWMSNLYVVAIVLAMCRQNWPCEIDMIECAQAGNVTTYTMTVHYGSTDERLFVKVKAPPGVTLNEWHAWKTTWTTEGIGLYIADDPGSPVEIASCEFTAAMIDPTDKYSLGQNQFFSMQVQTGDCTQPPAGTVISEADAIEQDMDWYYIDVPTTSLHLVETNTSGEVWHKGKRQS